MGRAVAAVDPFVHEWQLALKPEELHEPAYGVLAHADGDALPNEINAAVRQQITERQAH